MNTAKQLSPEIFGAANDDTAVGNTINDLLERDRDLYFEVKDLEDRIKELNKQRELLAKELQDRMEEQGIEKTSAGKSSVTLTKQEQPVAENWDELYDYINAHGANYLLQKRLSSKACLEQILVEGELPGVKVVEFTKPKLTHRR